MIYNEQAILIVCHKLQQLQNELDNIVLRLGDWHKNKMNTIWQDQAYEDFANKLNNITTNLKTLSNKMASFIQLLIQYVDNVEAFREKIATRGQKIRSL